jgi:hypothetical protein
MKRHRYQYGSLTKKNNRLSIVVGILLNENASPDQPSANGS